MASLLLDTVNLLQSCGWLNWRIGIIHVLRWITQKLGNYVSNHIPFDPKIHHNYFQQFQIALIKLLVPGNLFIALLTLKTNSVLFTTTDICRVFLSFVKFRLRFQEWWCVFQASVKEDTKAFMRTIRNNLNKKHRHRKKAHYLPIYGTDQPYKPDELWVSKLCSLLLYL